MHLEFTDYRNNATGKYNSVPVLEYHVLVTPPSLLLVMKSTCTEEHDGSSEECPFYQVFKVQFIASCRTEVGDGIVAIFYIDEAGNLSLTPISESNSKEYRYQRDECLLVDYVSYKEVCTFTGEKPLSFYKYIQEKYTGNQQPNSLLVYQHEVHNYDHQKALYAAEDAVTV